jgi:uncharacterized membrane protein YeaQ/YmgE (transglycosylase-associated protein family)
MSIIVWLLAGALIGLAASLFMGTDRLERDGALR